VKKGGSAKKQYGPLVTSKVYWDVSVNGEPAGKVVIGLYGKKVPKAAENFRALCTGEKGFGYKGTPFHRIIAGKILQGGDVENGDGTGGKSSYGENFGEETFVLKHKRPGLVGMSTAVQGQIQSQFYVTLAQQMFHLDGRYQVIGNILEGWEVMQAIQDHAGLPPTANVTIADSGEIELKEPFKDFSFNELEVGARRRDGDDELPQEEL